MGEGRTELKKGRFCLPSPPPKLDGPNPRFLKPEIGPKGRGLGGPLPAQWAGNCHLPRLWGIGEGVKNPSSPIPSMPLGAPCCGGVWLKGRSEFSHSPPASQQNQGHRIRPHPQWKLPWLIILGGSSTVGSMSLLILLDHSFSTRIVSQTDEIPPHPSKASYTCLKLPQELCCGWAAEKRWPRCLGSFPYHGIILDHPLTLGMGLGEAMLQWVCAFSIGSSVFSWETPAPPFGLWSVIFLRSV